MFLTGHILDPRPTEGPIKSPLSVCPSVGILLRNGSLIFFLIFGTMTDNWNT